MQTESMTLPNSVLQQFVTDTFVETGSYDGRTIQQALDCGFKEVRSVEVSPSWYEECKQRYGDDERVKLYLGDSIEMLPKMLEGITKPATLWLDAHIQEGAHGIHAAPLLYEIYELSHMPVNRHIIMIDDRRLMGTDGDWSSVTERQVLMMIQTINPDYKINYYDSKAAPQDIIVAHF